MIQPASPAASNGPDPDDFLTRAEVALMLRCNVKTVDRLRKSGQLPGVLISSKRFYTRGDVIAYIAAGGSERRAS